METPMKVEAEASAASGSPVVDIVPTDPVEIRELIRKQIEYYFSKENLIHDAFLTSQMDAQMSAPISVIMKFGKIKVLTQDESVLKEALVESTAVTVVENRIKSNFKPVGRSTIILRDIASDVPEEEVRSIFSYDGCKNISSIRKDIESTWFVIMDSEEDAKDTILDLKLKKIKFRNEAVKCRLKTEAVVKSYFPVSAPNASGQGNYGSSAPYMMPPYGQVDMRMYGYGGGWQQNNANNQGGEYSGDAQGSPNSRGSPSKDGNASKDGSKTGKDTQHKNGSSGAKDSTMGGRGDRKSQQQGQQQGQGQQRGVASKDASRNGQQGGRDRNNKTGAATGGAKGASWTEGKPSQRAQSFDISGMNFPPLAANEASGTIPTPGYSEPFTKYTHDDVINIVKNISDVVLPNTIEPQLHGFAMTDTPNMDLLQRQRTFSIDETREQLRQGKPVQRDAVVAGAVDMESMYYGDAAPTAGATAATSAPANSHPTKGNKPAGKSGNGSWAGILMKSGPPTETGPQPGAATNVPKKTAAPAAVEAPAAKTQAVSEPSAEENKTVTDKAAVVAASGAVDKKGKTDKKNKEPTKRGDGRKGPEGSETDAPQPSSWGGKPSFATILKQQTDADNEAAAAISEDRPATASTASAGPSTPNRKPAAEPAAPAASGGWGVRNKTAANGANTTSINKSGSSTESKIKAEASGAWVREKLPPVADKA